MSVEILKTYGKVGSAVAYGASDMADISKSTISYKTNWPCLSYSLSIALILRCDFIYFDLGEMLVMRKKCFFIIPLNPNGFGSNMDFFFKRQGGTKLKLFAGIDSLMGHHTAINKTPSN